MREFARIRGTDVGAITAHELGHFIRVIALPSVLWWPCAGWCATCLSPMTWRLFSSRLSSRGSALGWEPARLRLRPRQLNDLLEGNVNESAWAALLGAWMMIFGVVRFGHLQRSESPHPQRFCGNVLLLFQRQTTWSL